MGTYLTIASNDLDNQQVIIQTFDVGAEYATLKGTFKFDH
jgi:hypothetical protein